MSFCARCGAEARGAFCARCGAPTPLFADPASGALPGAASAAAAAGASVTAYPWVQSAAPGTTRGVADPGTPGNSAATQRRWLVLETWAVMFCFLLPAIAGALVLLAEHFGGVNAITRFPVIVHQPVENMLLGILSYLPVAAPVPIALLLLARTGQRPSDLGIGVPRPFLDVLPAIGLAIAAFLGEFVILIPLSPILASHKSLITTVGTGHVPSYYVIWGIVISLTTAITEEVLVNGYLLTRLDQLGWTPGSSLALSLLLRTSYHVYYGIGFLLTIPFGYFVTRSFQKHRRLTRCIAAHFIFDATLLTIAILR